jgi:hypothetical protein
MSFSFDLEAAIDAIAAIEVAISGVTTAYGYGESPVQITDNTLLPAVTHQPLGPQVAADGVIPGLLTMGSSYQLMYQIQSRLLITESTGKNYPADENASSGLWQAVANAFFNHTNRISLATSAGAHTYFMNWSDPSYGIRPWPPEPMQIRYYWALDYIHTFVFTG